MIRRAWNWLFAPPPATPTPPMSPEARIERMRNLLAFMLVGAFISMLPALTLNSIPTDNKEIVTYMAGQLSGMATMALGFYFVNKVGQDAVEARRLDLDVKRADNTNRMAQAVVAAATGRVDRPLEDMSLDELIAVAKKEDGFVLPDPLDEAVLRLALIARRDGGTA